MRDKTEFDCIGGGRTTLSMPDIDALLIFCWA